MSPSSNYLYGIDYIDLNLVSDNTIDVLRKIIGVKNYLDDTKKLSIDSTCIIAVVITMLNSNAPFPFQIENWKKYVLEYLDVDYSMLLENIFNINSLNTKKVIDNIWNKKKTDFIYLDKAKIFKKYVDKKLNLIKPKIKNIDIDYSYQECSVETIFEIFKKQFRKYIDKLDNQMIPIKLMNKNNIDSDNKKIVYFLIRISLESWNVALGKDIDTFHALKFMLALEKKLKPNCKKFNLNSYEFIDKSKIIKTSNLYAELEASKLLDSIYYNEKYTNPKQIYDKKLKAEVLNRINIIGPNEKIKKSIKNGGLRQIECKVYSNNVEVNRILRDEEDGKYVWFLNIAVGSEENIERIKFGEITKCKNSEELIKLNYFNPNQEVYDYNITSSNYFIRKSTYREVKAIIDMIFDKYMDDDCIKLLLELIKINDPYYEFNKYINQKMEEIPSKNYVLKKLN